MSEQPAPIQAVRTASPTRVAPSSSALFTKQAGPATETGDKLFLLQISSFHPLLTPPSMLPASTCRPCSSNSTVCLL